LIYISEGYEVAGILEHCANKAAADVASTEVDCSHNLLPDL
jgi:hypothetical protein